MAIELDTIYCLDAMALMQALPEQSVDAIITDVPYGTTACDWDVVIPFDAMWAGVKRVLNPRGVFVTTSSQPFTSMIVMSNLEWFRYEWIWEKQKPTGFLHANRMPLKSHESILVFGFEPPRYYPQDTKPVHIKNGRKTKSGRGLYSKVGNPNYIQLVGNYPRSVIRYDIQTVGTAHNTQKPVALFEYLIKTYTQPGEVVLDFCCGSGTTAVAAVKCGRHYICGDSSPEYVALAQKRLQDTNPYEPTQVDDTHTQLSLFSEGG